MADTYSLDVPFPVFTTRAFADDVVPDVPGVIDHRCGHLDRRPGQGEQRGVVWRCEAGGEDIAEPVEFKGSDWRESVRRSH
jgi:hypothetical protein